MPYVAFASTKASPGVTTTVAALSATWPDRRVLQVVEADPAGGDLAVRFDLSPEPGLVALAAAGRRGLDRETFLAHTQPLAAYSTDSQRRVLVGPVSPDQATASVSALRGIDRVLSSLDADVLVDCGRLDPGSPAELIACAADLLIMVTRPVVSEVHHLISRLSTLRPQALGVLTIGEKPYSVSEVAKALGATPFGTLPDDPRAAAAINVGASVTSGGLRRSRLIRTSQSLAVGLSTWLETLRPPEPAQLALPPASQNAIPRRPEQYAVTMADERPPTAIPQPPPPPPPPPQTGRPVRLETAVPEIPETEPTRPPLSDELTRTGPIPIVNLPPAEQRRQQPPPPRRERPAFAPKHYRSNGKRPGT